MLHVGPVIGNVHHGGESEWRISVIAGEVYAVLRRLPLERGYFDGPV